MLIDKILRGLFFRDHYLGNAFSPRAAVRLVARKEPVIIEVGAADGLDTVKFLAAMRGKGRLIAIEPDPRFKVSLEAMASANCEVFAIAIADADGTMKFHQSSTPYSSSLKEPRREIIAETWPEIEFSSTTQVETRSLDSLAEYTGLEQIDLIWADVQGAEDLLLKGGGKTLSRTRFLYTEFSEEEYYEGALPLGAILRELGPDWVLVRKYQGDALFRNKEFRIQNFH